MPTPILLLSLPLSPVGIVTTVLMMFESASIATSGAPFSVSAVPASI